MKDKDSGGNRGRESCKRLLSLGSPHHRGDLEQVLTYQKELETEAHGEQRLSGGWRLSGMIQGALSFAASQKIASNWTHRQDTTSKREKGRQTNPITQRNVKTKYTVPTS